MSRGPTPGSPAALTRRLRPRTDPAEEPTRRRSLSRLDPVALTRRARQPTDLRLLVPAVLAWALAAATLGLTASMHLLVAGAVGLPALVPAVVSSTRRRLRRGGVLGPLALTVLLMAALQVAAAAHGILRSRGGVESLAADRAAVTAVALVTSDPIRASRGAATGPWCCVRRPCSVLDARGLRRSTGAPVLLTGSPAIAGPGWRSTVLVRGRARADRPGR